MRSGTSRIRIPARKGTGEIYVQVGTNASAELQIISDGCRYYSFLLVTMKSIDHNPPPRQYLKVEIFTSHKTCLFKCRFGSILSDFTATQWLFLIPKCNQLPNSRLCGLVSCESDRNHASTIIAIRLRFHVSSDAVKKVGHLVHESIVSWNFDFDRVLACLLLHQRTRVFVVL